MTVTTSGEEDPVKTSGISEDGLLASLEAAEPQRRSALAATVNLIGGLGIMAFAGDLDSAGFLFGPFGMSFFLMWAFVKLMALGMLWALSRALWRAMAISVMAPQIGGAWGQTEFVAGVPAMEWRDFFDSGFPPRHGVYYTKWRSAGLYRDVRYRAREASHHYRKRPVQHCLFVEVALESSFRGPVEITSKTGPLGALGFTLRSITEGGAQIETGDPVFDAAFDVFCATPVSPDQVLTPALREALLNLSRQMPGRQFAAKMEYGWLLMELRLAGPSLQRASLFRPLPDHVQDAERLWWELTFPHRLIDTLKGDHDGRLY